MASGPISSLTNLLTGGSNNQAENDLQQALAEINAVPNLTAQQLQLSPLAQYSNTGNLTPAQMTAALAGPSAYNSENLSSVPMSTMQQALSQEGQIANAQGMTPQEKAAIAEAESASNENTAGQRGAIAQSFAGMGVPQSLISAALQNGTAGQNAQTDYLGALQAEGQAANQGITALSNEGTLAGSMYGQEAGQANTVASAQNALNQFNAANTQAANAANQGTQQAANTYNTQNAQNLSNQNVQGQQTVQEQNQVNSQLEAEQAALAKAEAAAGVNEAMAGQATNVGNQTLGIFGAGLGAAEAGMGGSGSPVTTGGANTSMAKMADGGEIENKFPAVPFKQGGFVPGQARVAGNSPVNDTVPAKLSPGEVVLPRTVAQNPGAQGSNISRFLQAKVPNVAAKMAPHPSDVASLMRAMQELRTA